MLVAFYEAEKTVGPERLHQALHRAQAQPGIEVAVNRNPLFDLLLAIGGDQLCALRFHKIPIWMVEQIREVIFSQAWSHPLKIDQMSPPVSHDDVLRLKIAMH